MDEHGITEGATKAGKVVGTELTRRSMVSENDCREWVSIIEAVNARERRLKPCVVFTGNNLQGQWFPEAFPDWPYDCTQTGFANGQICEKWLKEVFLPSTKPKDPTSWRILITPYFCAAACSPAHSWQNKAPRRGCSAEPRATVNLLQPSMWYSQETNPSAIKPLTHFPFPILQIH